MENRFKPDSQALSKNSMWQKYTSTKTQYDRYANPEHLINSVLFIANDRSYKQIVRLKKDIERAVSRSDLNVFYVMSQAERAKIIYDHLDIILTLFTFLSSLVLVISTLGMAAATGTNIMERTREIGVMRAIGATPEIIYGLFVGEGAVVSSRRHRFRTGAEFAAQFLRLRIFRGTDSGA